MVFHPSSHVHSTVSESSRACSSNFIDCNCLYGTSHCSRSYSSERIGNLAREIHSTHTSIPHFTHSEWMQLFQLYLYDFFVLVSLTLLS